MTFYSSNFFQKIIKAAVYGALLFWFCIASSVQLHANRLTIEVTRGIDNPMRIAIVPFRRDHKQGLDLASVIAEDLSRSGRFETLDRDLMLSAPASSDEVYYRDWRALGVEFLVVGQSTIVGGKRDIKFELVDITNKTSVFTRGFAADDRYSRKLAHKISDAVYQNLTGIPGAFATRILYVSGAKGLNSLRPNRLYVADSDGANYKVVLESKQPILSPVWSPDGKHIAYVSFEKDRPAIFRQNLQTQQREQLTNFRGLNSSPSWSPDGNRMAMVLSKDGNPEIYVMDLRTKALTRITNHYGIDTEPDWMPDGKSLVFTSDRGGSPQIYKANLAGGKPKRLTFEGVYNAGADVAPDGSSMVMVHRAKAGYQIAWFEFSSGRIIELTQSSLDESPSLAPNGAMLLYATKIEGNAELAAVAIDGGFRYRLPSANSDVREPAWSPF